MLKETLAKITGLLEQNSIPYMVIGGYAVAYHGESRLTEDIDITLGVDVNYLESLMKIFSKKFTPRIENVTDFVEKTNVLPVRDTQNSVKVDLIFSFIDFERNAIKHAESVSIGDTKIKIVSASDLIIYKLLAARERDLEDVRSVLHRNQANIDIPYIDTCVNEICGLSGRSDIVDIWKMIKDDIM